MSLRWRANGQPPREMMARSINVSRVGMQVDLDDPLPGGLEVDLEFQLPSGLLSGVRSGPYRRPARIVRAEQKRENGSAGGCRLAFRFDRDLKEVPIGASRLAGAGGVLLLVTALAGIVALKLMALDYFWYQLSFGVYSLVVTGYILSRFFLAAFHRPPPDVGFLPTVSVIIAARNEEAAIAKTLTRVFESDYPSDRLEVIAIDDGSTDGTLSEMVKVRERFPGLRIVRFPENRGKRHGMAAGARKAHGEILVYVDSDSFLERDALYRLAQGFADPEVGAVCAHGLVENSHVNLLTRMQAVQYYIAFRVLKAAESVFQSVTCCSGCCAAYRRSAVLEVLDDWLDQKFLGRPATFGDDRSLTNRMLRRYKVIFDETARVSTIVPETYLQFFRQQIRWKKSWLRENLIAASFIWRKPPIMAISFYIGFLFPLFAPFVVGRALLYLPLFHGRPNTFYLLGIFLISLVYAAYYLRKKRDRLWVYAPLLCFFYAFLITWQLPWAILTSWNNKWGTR